MTQTAPPITDAGPVNDASSTPEKRVKAALSISVLIATRNRPQDLVPCLTTILAQDYSNFDIWVIDQSTTDASEAAVREALGSPENLHYIRSASVGKSLALNELVAAGTGEIFAFTDDDTEAKSDWLKQIVAAFEEFPEADVVFGQVFQSKDFPGYETMYTPAFYFDKPRWLSKGEVAGMGANMAAKRASIRRAGKFDVLLGPGADVPAAEEGDWVYRAQLDGIRVLLHPGVRLIHRAWRTYEEWNRVLYGYGIGDAAFTLKHLRCGDMRTLKSFIVRPMYIFARLCHRLIHRKGHQEEHYLRGYWQGVRMSMRYRVDRQSRLFVAPGSK
jgi:GT2 family glycosyltransferase